MRTLTKRLVLTGLALLFASALRAQTPVWELPIFHLSQGEWRGAVLTEIGREIAVDVARSAAAAPVTLFDINGWADMSATPASQRRLSDARVVTVREELISDGVAAGDIGVLIADRPDGAVPPLPQGEAKRVVIVVYY